MHLLADGAGEPRAVGTIAGSVEDFRFSPDGTRILALAADPGSDRAGADSGTRIGAEEADPQVTRPAEHWRRLYTIDVATGETLPAGPDGLNIWEFDWRGGDVAAVAGDDPSGERLVRGPARPDRPRRRRGRDAAPTGDADRLSGHLPRRRRASRSSRASARTAAFSRARRRSSPPAAARLPCSPRSSTSAASRGGTSAHCGSRPSPASARRAARSRSTAPPTSSGAARHRSPRGGCRRSPRPPTAACSRPRTAPGRARPSCACSTPAAAAAGWRALSALNPAAPAVDAVCTRRTWTSDEFDVEGLVLTPAGGGRELPLVVWVHGGPTAAYGFEYPDARFIALVDAGYAILLPNPRGSAGRGQAFARANLADMGGGDLRDILAGVDALVGEGLVDDDRVAIAGISYGGFMAAWAIGQTDRFRRVDPDRGRHQLAVVPPHDEHRPLRRALPRRRAVRSRRATTSPARRWCTPAACRRRRSSCTARSTCACRSRRGRSSTRRSPPRVSRPSSWSTRARATAGASATTSWTAAPGSSRGSTATWPSASPPRPRSPDLAD